MKTHQKKTAGFEIRLAKDTPLDGTSTVNFHYVHYVYPPQKHTISFKGGGVRVFVYEAFIKKAKELGFFHSIKQVGGSSSGAVAAIVSAIHFVDEKSQQAMFDAIFNANKRDLVGHSTLEKMYDSFSSLIYQPFLLIADGLTWIGKKLNILGLPLHICAAIFELTGGIISTRALVGLYNLIRYQGIYYGEKLQLILRDQIQQYVQKGLEDILNKNMDQQQQIIDRLLKIKLGEMKNDKFVVQADITFLHFAELAKLPQSQFKEIYLTGAKINKESDDAKTDLAQMKRKKLVVFNANNEDTQNCPIHTAAKIATAIPIFYQPVMRNGKRYIDGGALNNSPVDLAQAQKVSPELAAYGLTDHLTRLQVRVEYPDDFKNHLWRHPQKPQGVKKFFADVKKKYLSKSSIWIRCSRS